MAARVSVTVATVVDGERLCFSGEGELWRDRRGIHLTYRYKNSGQTESAQLHLGMGRAVITTPSYRLLLDPSRATRTLLTAEGSVLPLDVETHRVEFALSAGVGTVILHYTLLAQGRPLQTMEVSLTLAPMDKETTI